MRWAVRSFSQKMSSHRSGGFLPGPVYRAMHTAGGDAAAPCASTFRDTLLSAVMVNAAPTVNAVTHNIFLPLAQSQPHCMRFSCIKDQWNNAQLARVLYWLFRGIAAVCRRRGLPQRDRVTPDLLI